MRALPLVLLLASLEAAAQPAADKPITDRLRDDSGDVAGLPGWKIQRKPDAAYCGGIKIVTTSGKKKLPADDQPMANVFALEFPTGLDFDPDPKHTRRREASLKKFNDFVQQMTKVGGMAKKHYEGWIADGSRDAEAKVRAMARIAQIQMRMASLIARAEIPKDVRSGEMKEEKMAAFCDKLSEVAEPLLAQAEEATRVCNEKLSLAPSAGWWTTVCTPAP